MRPQNQMIELALAVGLTALALVVPADPRTTASSNPASLWQAETAEYAELPGAGKKCRIDDEFHFIYEFTEKPRMGTAILRVRVFGPDENRSTDFTILGRSDMPSMAGAHDSGEQEFKLNTKGDYLLPVHIAMPGEWEVKLTFKRGDSVVFRGAFRFDV